MVKFSITLNSFSNIEQIEHVIKLLIESGLYYIEIPGDPFNTSLKKKLEIINTYNLSVIGVTGLWTRSKELSPILLTTDQDILSFSIDYIKECIKMCNYFGGTFFNICLLSDKDLQLDYNHEIIPRKDKRKLLKRILPILSKLTYYSKEFGVSLLLEPLNRYSTPFCSDTTDAIYISSNIDNEYFAILLDTYHMNIEEKSFFESINKTKKYLKHIHFSDNNRKMPGLGHINFNSIFKTLSKIQYTNYIGLEPIFNKNYNRELSKSLKYLNRISTKYQI
ncbi:MAG TPA: sugar phosphate isomerase/epimerase family protein [Nitrososphaeraceae archaeon]|nr:sugar phosphate isomerase/epimerase family protein [Nitrososphaeraceae archaeon]